MEKKKVPMGVLDGWVTKRPSVNDTSPASPNPKRLATSAQSKPSCETQQESKQESKQEIKKELKKEVPKELEKELKKENPQLAGASSNESSPIGCRKRLRSPHSTQRNKEESAGEEQDRSAPRAKRFRRVLDDSDVDEIPSPSVGAGAKQAVNSANEKKIPIKQKQRDKTSSDINKEPKSPKSPSKKSAKSVSPPTDLENRPGLSLQGMKIVLTGEFNQLKREEMELHIKRNGGLVMSAVSSRTDFLVHGSSLEDGRSYTEGSKYRKAMELQTGVKPDGTKTKTTGKIQVFPEEEFLQKYPAVSTPAPSTPAPTSQLPTPRESPPRKTSRGGELWSERWRPTKISEILGNGETVKKLVTWLQDWHEVCIEGKVKVPPKKRGFGEPERINARAAILSGPPGIGKTTAAKVVAKTCGFEILEFNASDDRGKKIVEVIGDMTSGGQTLTSKRQLGQPTRTVVIMDEMDGLSAGDRGGAQALMKLIEKTKSPIICICNDRMHPKVRTLVTKCYDLKFNKPPKNVVAKRICEIAQKEGLSVEYNAIELLCEQVGNDIRQIFNMLQLMAHDTRRNEVTFDNMRKEIGFGLKDMQVMANPFDTARKLLTRSESSKLDFNGKLDCYFIDFDIMPLYMHENYLSSFASRNQGVLSAEKEIEALAVLATVADCFTMSDLMSVKLRKEGSWSLLPDVGLFSTIVPSCMCSGFIPRAEFPKWLGKNSTTTKNKRLLSELQLYLSPVTTCSPISMRTSGYLDLLYEHMLSPLTTGNDSKEQARQTMQNMDEYGLTKDQVIENMGCLRLKRQEKLYELVDSSVKRALTSLYNSSSHVIRMAPPVFSVKKKSAAIKGPSRETEEGGEGEGTAPQKDESPDLVEEENQEGEEDDSAYLDRLFLAKKKAKAKTSPKRKAAAKRPAAKKKAPAKAR